MYSIINKPWWKRMYVCVWLSHFTIQQRWAQHCKSIVLKFYKSLFNLKLPCVTGCYRVGQLSFWGHLDSLQWVAPLLALRKHVVCCLLRLQLPSEMVWISQSMDQRAVLPHVGLNEESCQAVGRSCEVPGLSSHPKDVWVVSHPVFLQTALQGSAGGKEACCLVLSPAFLLLCTESHHKGGTAPGL